MHLHGERNGMWKGGKALAYGPGWRRIKEVVRQRDGVCRRCGKTPKENGRALNVHHIEPLRFSGDHSHDNLVALCRSCHMRTDDHGRRGQARFLRRQGIEKPPTKRATRRREARRRKIEAMRSRAMLQARAFELAAQGRSLRQIAQSLGVSHQTVANWLSGAVRSLVS
jgi:5-methylcytosine-specific restriction endonuclease McrA